MRNAWAIGLLTIGIVSGLTACWESGSPQSARDAADSVDTGDFCSTVEAEADEFVVNNRDCTSDSDCVYVGGTNDCSCSRFLGGAVNKDAVEGMQSILRKYDDCDDPRKICDWAPPERVYCEDGECAIEPGSCLSAPPDTGDARDDARDVRDSSMGDVSTDSSD